MPHTRGEDTLAVRVAGRPAVSRCDGWEDGAADVSDGGAPDAPNGGAATVQDESCVRIVTKTVSRTRVRAGVPFVWWILPSQPKGHNPVGKPSTGCGTLR